jgi:uncharacterized protein with HEPN domain
MRDDGERLRDMLEAISQIEKYVILGKDKFTEDELIQIWIIHHLMIIGEASSKMSEATRQNYPDVPWVGIIDVRNIITHEYFRVNLDIIWKIVMDDLPNLTEQIQNILEEIGNI